MFFLLAQKAQKKEPKKTPQGHFAACARRQGLRALDWRPLPWGASIGAVRGTYVAIHKNTPPVIHTAKSFQHPVDNFCGKLVYKSYKGLYVKAESYQHACSYMIIFGVERKIFRTLSTLMFKSFIRQKIKHQLIAGVPRKIRRK